MMAQDQTETTRNQLIMGVTLTHSDRIPQTQCGNSIGYKQKSVHKGRLYCLMKHTLAQKDKATTRKKKNAEIWIDPRFSFKNSCFCKCI